MTVPSVPGRLIERAAAADHRASLQLVLAAALAAFLLWAVAFSPVPLAHNAAHDVRHVSGTSCH